MDPNKHFLRRYITLLFIPQRLPKKVHGSMIDRHHFFVYQYKYNINSTADCN